MGTPEFALPSLEMTRQRAELALVVTQPDRRAGRGRKYRPPPVKVAAEAAGIEVVQPVRSITRELGERLADIAPDVIVVAAFGKFLGRKILELPTHGCVNVHASILPRHRGASPPVWAILSGDGSTGVSVQRMAPGMDEGDLLGQLSTPIDPEETAGELTTRLSLLGAEALSAVLGDLEAGSAAATPQDHSAATLAPPLRKQDGVIDWSQPALNVHDHVRAMNPWPVAFTSCADGQLRVHRTRVCDLGGALGVPGQILQADRKGLRVACGQGSVELVEAQREGKCVCCGPDLVAGRAVEDGHVLGAPCVAVRETS